MTIEEIRVFVVRNQKSLIAIVVVVLLVIGGTLAATAEQRCVARGLEYFKEIGSYPTLTTGRRAENVAEERCARTTEAF